MPKDEIFVANDLNSSLETGTNIVFQQILTFDFKRFKMSEVLNITIVRSSQAINEKQKEKLGFKTHKNQVSNRYQNWLELNSKKNNDLFTKSLLDYLKSSDNITTYEKLPSSFQTFFALFVYEKDEVPIPLIKKLIHEKNCESFFKDSKNYTTLKNSLEDQLLASAITGIYVAKFDIQYALKVLELFKKLCESNIDKIENLNLEKYFDKPMILNIGNIILNPCDFDNSYDMTTPISSGSSSSNDSSYASKTFNTTKASNTCEKDETCYEPDFCCGRVKTYIADLFVIKDTTDCYRPSEISHIENIIESEVRLREHRHLQREELYTEDETETKKYNEKTHKSDENYSLNTEVERVIEQELSLNAGASYSQKSANGLMEFSTNADMSFNQSKSNASSQAIEKSKNIIDNAISKIEKNSRRLATKKFIDEVEETNKHSFGGETGAKSDISRQFYFVNQIKKAQAYNYGKRMMIDLFLPEPATLYKELMKREFEGKKPDEVKNYDCSKITTSNYLTEVSPYGISPVPVPSEKKPDTSITMTLSQTDVPNGENDYRFPIEIPVGYTATNIHLNQVHMNKKGHIRKHRIHIHYGSGLVFENRTNNNITDSEYDDGLSTTGAGEILVRVDQVKNFRAIVTITLKADEVDNSSWKNDICSLIQEKIKEQKQDYELALKSYHKDYEEFLYNEQERISRKYNRNPFVLSEVIKEQLKQAAISYLSCQFYDDNNSMINKVQPCCLPQMHFKNTDKNGDFIRFFEHAFEWKFLNYILYPYFWARKTIWRENIQEEGSSSFLFSSFLESGEARVTIAVRPGFEYFVEYFLQTKKTWGAIGMPPLVGDGFLSMFQELKENKDNFNKDRLGKVIHLTNAQPPLNDNQIVLNDNFDYYDYTDPLNPIFDQNAASVDRNREIIINCNTYKITAIEELNGVIVITLDRDFNEDKDYEYLWGTGSLFEGAPWKYTIPTSLIWMRENERCLPCEFPIKCV
ncbi:MAG: hypothetical protein COB42_00485 [Sulfurimonas sp.]|nr:MAG: hypothetical protein COB42_00485 [Sulfurimonas sp.]